MLVVDTGDEHMIEDDPTWWEACMEVPVIAFVSIVLAIITTAVVCWLSSLMVNI